MQALENLPSLEKMEYEQDIYGITYGTVACCCSELLCVT